MPSPKREPGRPAREPLWYKDAILYELHVRAFQDSDGDGIGDFNGLATRLDYLQDLGVTAIWLLPFYPSPLRDDGYDTADYTRVHPFYGDLKDFRRFLKEAHRRGLRVITELVLNHTSDQHPWFQRARRAPRGSAARDFYVWSDAPEKYKEARIIFKDFEHSNWSWDALAGQYYWHRFYAHQPDLNWDNPQVKKAMFHVLDFWLGDVGVDGLRLDAVPYLFEREGTNCENLAETHAALKELRAHVDRKFGDRMLLAEANQWPEDAVAYFGQGAGDECHTAFHFPIMPRLFMGIRTEDRYPIVDILEQTPPIPETSQWVLFLRNHDELTLEMVTDEERDYMYRVYAAEPQARINLGIRRRLAPLLESSRRKIELMNGLLFSLPGTPVLYYGDEIGMGDNFYLGDRNGVRTPMQWSPDRNAGFSRANSQRLYLPVIIDPEYHYEAVNVEVQQKNPQSLLWWTKNTLSLRRQFRAFGRGTMEFVHPDNPKVLAFVRRHESENILVVANLSRFAQHAELPLVAFAGREPLELFGRTRFPTVGEAPYPIALGPHGFYWFSLEAPRAAASGPSDAELPTLRVRGPLAGLFAPAGHPDLEPALPGCLAARPWFRGAGRGPRAATIEDAIPYPPNAALLLVRVEFAEGEAQTYTVPLAWASGPRAEDLLRQQRAAVLARLKSDTGAEGVLYEAHWDAAFCVALLGQVARQKQVVSEAGELRGVSGNDVRRTRKPEQGLPPSVMAAGRSNTAVNYGNRFVLKFVRRAEAAPNPDLELARALTARGFAHMPRLHGWLEYEATGGRTFVLALLQAYVANEGAAWHHAQDDLGRYFERALSQQAHGASAPVPAEPLAELAAREIPPGAQELVGAYLQSAALLGRRTAEMHLVLAGITDDPDFAPEPFSALYQRSVVQSLRNASRQGAQLLRRRLRSLPAEARAEAQQVIDLEPEMVRRTRAAFSSRVPAPRIRIHGNLHLGQLLYTGKDFLILAFEGEPVRSAAERRIKRAALRDVASMLGSFHYVAYSALLGRRGPGRPEDLPALEPWVRAWTRWVGAAFVRGYLETPGIEALLPPRREETFPLLGAYQLDHLLADLSHELDSNPAWVRIPLTGILEVLGPRT